MKFIKVGKNWLIKNSNGRIVSDKEKKQLEKLNIKNNECKECEIKTIVINEEDIPKVEGVIFNEEITPKAIIKPIKKKKKTATSKKEIANDIIKETDIVI